MERIAMRRIGTMLTCLCLLTVVSPALGEDGAPPGGEVWRVANRCGVNTIFLMFRLTGRPADYRAVNAAVPVTEKGTSLADLRRSAARFGINARIIKSSPAMLRRVPKPVI